MLRLYKSDKMLMRVTISFNCFYFVKYSWPGTAINVIGTFSGYILVCKPLFSAWTMRSYLQRTRIDR